jgi:hypothetical protein
MIGGRTAIEEKHPWFDEPRNFLNVESVRGTTHADAEKDTSDFVIGRMRSDGPAARLMCAHLRQHCRPNAGRHSEAGRRWPAELESLATTINSLQKNSDASDQKAVVDARKQASYASNIDFYDKLQSSITALDTRMTAISDLSTAKLSNALTDLEKNVSEVRSTHASEGILSADYVKDSRQILDQQFKALTVYELTIKSGSKPK